MTVWTTTFAILETLSDIVDDASFACARSQLKRMRKVIGDRLLPQPDVLFRQFLDLPLKQDEEVADIEQYLEAADVIINCQSRSDCPYSFDGARSVRAKIEEDYMAGVVVMLRSMNPNLRTIPDWHSRLPPAELKVVKEWLYSPTGRRRLLEAAYMEHGVPNPTMMQLAKAWYVLEPYYHAFRGLLIRVLENNVKPRPNDYVDLRLMIPVWLEGWTLLTADGPLRKNLRRGEASPEKFSTLDDFLNG